MLAHLSPSAPATCAVLSCCKPALGFGLAPDHARGQYQGLLGLGFDAGQAVGPAVLVTAVLGIGQAGRLVLGIFLALLGLLGPVVTDWAERTRATSREAATVAR